MDCSQHYKRSACRSVDYHSRVLAFKTELPPASDKLIRANIEEADSVFAGEISLFPELRNANKPIQEVEEIVFGAVYARESEILGSILLEWASVSTKRDVLRAEMMNCTLAFSYASTASATVEAGIGSGINGRDARWQTCEHAFQMPCDLGAGGPIAIAQLARDVLPGLGQKRQDWLEALLSPVFRVVALAPGHLFTEHGVHGGVRIHGDHLQLNVSRLPHALTQDPLHFQYLPGHTQMQRSQKPPEGD
jgi:hypothetical protein